MSARHGFIRPDRAPHRVLLLTTSYPLHAGSVSGVFVHRLAQALARECELRVLVPADSRAEEPADLLPAAPPVRTFRYAPRPLQTLAHGAGGIPAALAARRANLLLVPSFVGALLAATWRDAGRADVLFANWSICGVAAGLVGRSRGIPVVVTLRGEDANRAAGRRGAMRGLLGACMRLCDGVVTVSDAMAETLAAAMPQHAGKLVVIPNGVAPEFLSVPPPQQSGEALRLLCVASLIPRKSVATLVRALAALPPTVTLTLVGEGGEAAALAALADALGVAARIRVLPFQPPERLPGLLADADAFVLPSLAEGRPNVVLEAFAAARPVVATDIDGLRELVGADERGLLFAPGDADALAACIGRLADPSLRAALGLRARRFVLDEGLTWERAAARYAQLFDELAARRNPP